MVSENRTLFQAARLEARDQVADAIGAGLILGTIAMRTKSIWGGVLIHVGVAMTMDVFALRGCPPIGSNRWCGY